MSLEIHPFSLKIQDWYLKLKRDLPWRETKDPYKIWLSEIILQQTRVAQGLPYYMNFVENYPDVISLSKAPVEEVMRLWQGLGYYSRCRNMHETAKIIVEKYDAQFPNQFSELIKLKGIGDYTAAAISSFSSQEAVAVLDGNVYRVLSRYFGILDDVSSTKTKKVFLEIASQVLDISKPDLHNQAIMEFGAIQCTPKRSKCKTCPLIETCYAFNHNMVDKLPVKLKKTRLREMNLFYAVLIENNRILMKERTGEKNNIWKGLFDFPEISKEQFDHYVKLNPKLKTVTYQHQLTHRKLNLNFMVSPVHLSDLNLVEGKFYDFSEVENLPKPIVIDRFIKELNKDKIF
ncbi:MAG: A/G-specific adenine glycosylase [Cytophagales bacterium]